MVSTLNENLDLLTGSDEIVFENNEQVSTENLIETSNMDFDFNELQKNNNRATKPKLISKEKRKKRNQMRKTSRRKNRQ